MAILVETYNLTPEKDLQKAEKVEGVADGMKGSKGRFRTMGPMSQENWM